MLTMIAFPFLLVFAILIDLDSVLSQQNVKPCSPKDYGFGRIVCVCNDRYCDSLGTIKMPRVGEVIIYESNNDGNRFNREDAEFWNTTDNRRPLFGPMRVTINPNEEYQKILGFGGAFTDAAGININFLSRNLQAELLKGYYSSEGLEYNIGRVPMASCDFSTRIYSYCDVANDFQLNNFRLAAEDIQYKIPFIKQAMKMSSKPLLLFASPWGPPYWMKTTEKMQGPGVLKGKIGGPYYKTWAQYFVKFLQAYERHNLTFWGMTAQNEPIISNLPFHRWQALGFTAELQRDFIKYHLGPALKDSGYGADKLKLMILDDQLIQLPRWAEVVLDDSAVSEYVSGIALHWYMNNLPLVSRDRLDRTHSKFPDKFILATEACVIGSSPVLGSWQRGEQYAHDIIQDLLHSTVGWVDWNLALDLEGGPNWAKNFVDSPVIVNTRDNEFYRQPMYYVLGHFSKFLPRGSVRIGLKIPLVARLEVAAFKRPDQAIVLIALNRHITNIGLSIEDPYIGKFVRTIRRHSIQTFIWRHK